jgi:biopolymer transport protein ExbD
MTAEKFAGHDPEASATQAKPHINVTPLIDVLLVVLIIFMVVSPLKPARFLTKVPSKPDPDDRVSPLRLVWSSPSNPIAA